MFPDEDRIPTGRELAAFERIKDNARAIEHELDLMPKNRYQALAKTQLELCVVWAEKGIKT